MNIAMIVRGYLNVPQPKDMIYAPIDLAAQIADGLTRRGHKVDFYAPTGSKLKLANIRSLNLRPLAKSQQEFRDLITNVDKMVHYFPGVWEGTMVNDMFQRAEAGELDILHFHHPEAALLSSYNHPKIPVVYTLHDPIHDWYREMFDLYKSDNQYFVSISNNQRRDAPDLKYIRTVYNGVDINQYKFDDTPEDYLLYCGRIVPEKGIKEAIEVAQQTHHRLIMIGPVYADVQGYFDQYVKPHLNDQILYLGFLEKEQIPKYYQKAKALLTPVQWEEPFGLTTIEAMASGTPVISFRRGAAPEIIVDGKTGFIAENTAEMIDAVHKIKDIKRADCRRHVEENFSIDKMVDGYEMTFENILRQRKRLSAQFLRSQLKKVPYKLRESSRRRRLKQTISSNSARRVLLPREASTSKNR